MEYLTVLDFDPGARGHARSWAYEQSPDVKKIIVAPGNKFIGWRRDKEVIVDENCDLKDPESMIALAEKYRPDLIDVAQDDAIATGVGDMLRERGFVVFCPTQKAAQIEWDKAWSYGFAARHGIPIPESHAFSSTRDAEWFVTELYEDIPDYAIYVKAAGLAAGKGALKATSYQQAVACIRRMHTFGDAGKSFVIQKGLSGPEFSYTVIADGTGVYHAFKPAQDYKLAHAFDGGDQTGGMACVAPTRVIEPLSRAEIEEKLVIRALDGMADEDRPYMGILYVGGMKVADSNSSSGYRPYCIEYNARWGDPEAQVVLPGVSNYAALVMAAAEGRLAQAMVQEDTLFRVCLVGAARGYPNDYHAVAGKRIYGLEEAMRVPGVQIFGAGIEIVDGRFYAQRGRGRLFSVVGASTDPFKGYESAFAAMNRIYIEGNNLQWRSDGGWQDRDILYRSLKV